MSPPRLGQGGKTALIGAGFTVDEINQLTSSGAAVLNDEEGI